MPWGKDFLTEEQSPWCIAFLSTLLFGILFTLWDSIDHMITTTSQRWHLKKLIKILQWLWVFWHIFYWLFNGIELHVKWHWSNGFNELLITLSMLLHFVISCSTHNLLVFMAGLFSSPWYHHRWYLILKMWCLSWMRISSARLRSEPYETAQYPKLQFSSLTTHNRHSLVYQWQPVSFVSSKSAPCSLWTPHCSTHTIKHRSLYIAEIAIHNSFYEKLPCQTEQCTVRIQTDLGAESSRPVVDITHELLWQNLPAKF